MNDGGGEGGGGVTAPPPALAATQVEKRFGRTQALKGVTLDIDQGVIHALVGENGAGKSTFLGIAAGRISATRGEVRIHGEQLPGGDPRAARLAGVASIYQELAVVPPMTAVANVFLGVERERGGFLDEHAMRDRFRELRDRLGVKIEPEAIMRDLSIADQQSVEIMRGLQTDASVLLLDEPTSALERTERQRLFKLLLDVKQEGVTSVFVTHDLDDVLELADAVSVFRDGALVASGPIDEWTKSSMVAAMLGKAVTAMPHRSARQTAKGDRIAVSELNIPGILDDISFTVAPGEIVGLGGLAGSGRSTLLRAIAGVGYPNTSGSLAIDGRSSAMPRSPVEAAGLGIGLIPEDRKTQGLVLGLSALENICLPEFGSPAWRIYSKRAAQARAVAVAESVGFDPKRLGTPARNLSGGNQQKLLLARWASRELNVLLADEPTRGVDVGAKAEILETLRTMAEAGLSMVVASSELEELEALADRVIVLAAGRIVTILSRDDGITAGRILEAAFKIDDTKDREERP